MKMSYRDLEGKPKTLQSLTGLNPQEFSILLKSFELAWATTLASSVNNPNRQRAYGAGRKSELRLIEVDTQVCRIVAAAGKSRKSELRLIEVDTPRPKVRGFLIQRDNLLRRLSSTEQRSISTQAY